MNGGLPRRAGAGTERAPAAPPSPRQLDVSVDRDRADDKPGLHGAGTDFITMLSGPQAGVVSARGGGLQDPARRAPGVAGR